MALPTFPRLPGETWPVTKTPMQSTTTVSHVSGREVRVRNWAKTLYTFELGYDGVASSGDYIGLSQDSLQMLMGLFQASGGSQGTFLYEDPTDSYATGEPLGTGDGYKTSFPFRRTVFNWQEPVDYVAFVQAVYFNGVAQVGNWNLANPTADVPYPNLMLSAAPDHGVVVSADFNWQFVCRFADDSYPFDRFMKHLWSTKLKFQSVRNGGFP